MHQSVGDLSEREKDTLRLLREGHDVKSIARHLDLSVHTINERLRDARRKLGVTSSREAARVLATVEQTRANLSADAEFGVGGATPPASDGATPHRGEKAGFPLAWIAGGMLIMSLFIATIALVLVASGSGASPTPVIGAAQAPNPVTSDPRAAEAAMAWAGLLDRQLYAESWDVAGKLFKAGVAKDQWVTTIKSVRQPLGAVAKRALQKSFRTTSLPGAPAGDYEVVELRTSFASKPDAIETVVLAREDGSWTVNGYFIR